MHNRDTVFCVCVNEIYFIVFSLVTYFFSQKLDKSHVLDVCFKLLIAMGKLNDC